MLLSLKNVEKKLGGKLIIPPMNLNIAGGHVIGLLGPNGSGKTTLLKLIAGLSYPTNGQLLLNNAPYTYPQTSWYINYLPDSLIFPTEYTVQNALEFYEDNFIDFQHHKALEILDFLQIPLTQQFSYMSKGQQERVTLALVLARKSQLTILDEPLAAIDVVTRDQILVMIEKFLDKSSSIIISTHLIFDMQDLFDEVILLQNGSIVAYQDVESLTNEQGINLLTYYRQMFGFENGGQI